MYYVGIDYKWRKAKFDGDYTILGPFKSRKEAEIKLEQELDNHYYNQWHKLVNGDFQQWNHDDGRVGDSTLGFVSSKEQLIASYLHDLYIAYERIKEIEEDQRRILGLIKKVNEAKCE